MSSPRTQNRSGSASAVSLMVFGMFLQVFLRHLERILSSKLSITEGGGYSYGFPNDDASEDEEVLYWATYIKPYLDYLDSRADNAEFESSVLLQAASVGDEAEWFANSPSDTETRQDRIRRVRSEGRDHSPQDQEQDG